MIDSKLCDIHIFNTYNSILCKSLLVEKTTSNAFSWNCNRRCRGVGLYTFVIYWSSRKPQSSIDYLVTIVDLTISLLAFPTWYVYHSLLNIQSNEDLFTSAVYAALIETYFTFSLIEVSFNTNYRFCHLSKLKTSGSRGLSASCTIRYIIIIEKDYLIKKIICL